MRRLAVFLLVLSPFPAVAQPQGAGQNLRYTPAIGQGRAVRGGDQLAGDAVPFTTPEGRTGWRIVFPGGNPLTTPAVVEGKVFLGGGFGSHEFYAFDAVSGKKLWHYRTRDDGPTAPLVLDGHVVFSTESGELEVLIVDGKSVWKRWLGDPLLSMPAGAPGRIYMAYPESKGKGQHFLACFDLKTGIELWRSPIAGEVITTPVVGGSRVGCATVDGRLYGFRLDGSPAWEQARKATSAPLLVGDICYFTCRVETAANKDAKGLQQKEMLAVQLATADAVYRCFNVTNRDADYLDYNKRGGRSQVEQTYQEQDNRVGLGGQRKGAAKIDLARDNLGQASVAGVWSYQGSRPVVAEGRVVTAMGDVVKCVDAQTEALLWRREWAGLRDKGELLDATLTPPALINGKVFLGTARGEVVCLSVRDGTCLWSATVGEPIAFQPVVAQGRIYLATRKGSLICLETGDPRDDGWLMWGGGPGRNGSPQVPQDAKGASK